MLGDFLKALGQLGDARFLRVMVVGVALSLALLFGIYAILVGLVDQLIPGHIKIPFVGEIGGITALFDWGSLALVLVLSVFLMMPVASAFSAFFLDWVADAVEDRHYPGLPPVQGMGLGAMLLDTLAFLTLLIAVNLLSLVLWAVTGPVMPLITWGLNGYLLGREFFTLVAARHLGREGAMAMRRRFSTQVWLAGVLMAAPLAFPLVNLLVPVLGVATFTHMFHRLQRSALQ
ncbi:MAG: EI24 domain-containing protein [Candidatus Saccharibacteria bacterium]|nr:EI24 domain-containing protein [Pseudorhodobacter sp.]